MHPVDKAILWLAVLGAVLILGCILLGTNYHLKISAATNSLLEQCLKTPRTVQECKELTK